MKFRGYPVTKDSGVPWIGEVPGHWTISKVKWLFNVVNGATPASNEEAYWDGGIPFATPDDLGKLEGDTLANTSRSISEQGYHSCGTNLVPRGSLLISTRAPIGHIAIAGTAVCTNQGIRSLVKKQPLNSKYFYYLLRAAVPELQSRGQGTTFQELPATQLKAVDLCVPPESEQGTIADFLDGQSQDIQILISKSNLLKNLLQEYRQALITKAVTKGLDPNVPMKDSGIPWLGEIPEHWRVLPLKRVVCHVSRGATPSYVDHSTVPVINQACIYWDGLKLENVKYHDPNVPVGNKGYVLPGDLLINSTGTGTLGRAVVFVEDERRYIADTHVTVVRVENDRYEVKYLHQLLSTPPYQAYVYSALTSGATNQIELSREGLRNLLLPMPPLEEQQAICDFLEDRVRAIGLIIEQQQLFIDRLQEYRQALITAAVTGKIDICQDQEGEANGQDVC